MTSPDPSIFAQRAGANPVPNNYVEPADALAHTPDDADAWASGEYLQEEQHGFAAVARASTPRIFWADISEFQRVVTSAYPYQQLAIRLDTGGRLDNNAKANHSAWLRMNRGALIGYVVFIPGQSRAILRRIQNAFGRQLEGIAPMTDMESGAGFAGGGNHSREANDFQDALAEATGSRAREIGYANASDWATNWPSRPSWMKRVIASYGSQLHNDFFGHQFYGGLDYPVPSGFPRACAPFGSWVDLNTAAMTSAAFNGALFGAPTLTDFLEEIMALPGAPKGLTYQQFLSDLAKRFWDETIALPEPADDAPARRVLGNIHTTVHADLNAERKG